MTGPFGAIAIVLSFVVGFMLPTATRMNFWVMCLIGVGLGVGIGLAGGLLDFAFGTSW